MKKFGASFGEIARAQLERARVSVNLGEWLPLPTGGLVDGTLLGLLEPEAIALDLDDLGAVGEPIGERHDAGGVGEDLGALIGVPVETKTERCAS